MTRDECLQQISKPEKGDVISVGRKRWEVERSHEGYQDGTRSLLEMEDADETDFSVDDQDPDDPDRQCGIRYCSVVLVENLKKRYLSQNALSLSTDVHTICVGEWWD